MNRCPWAIKLGTLATRCALSAGHKGNHEGRGLSHFSYQSIEWFPGDRREFLTDIDNAHAWEEMAT